MIKKLVAAILLISLAGLVQAKTIVDLAQSGIGARPLSMGKAFTAISEGSNGIYSNPAGTGFVRNFDITTMQTKILNTADYKMYGGIIATNFGNFGLGYINVLSPAGYATTDKNSLAAAPQMAYSGSTYILSYGQSMNKFIKISPAMGNLAFGINIKVIRNYMSGITSGNGNGSDNDLGFLLKTPNNFNFGATLQNFSGGNISWDSGNKDKLPSILKLGISYKLKNPNILFALDTENYAEANHPMLIHTGVEWAATGNLSLRFGIDQSALGSADIANNPAFGVGMNVAGVVFDYAYRQESRQTDAGAHYISLSISPGISVPPIASAN